MSEEKQYLVRLVFKTPDENFSDLAVVDEETFNVLKEFNDKSEAIHYKVASTTEATEIGGIYILASQGNPTGYAGYTTTDQIRSWYQVIDNIYIDHNGLISKANN